MTSFDDHVGDNAMTSSIGTAQGLPALVGKKVDSQSSYIQHLWYDVKICYYFRITMYIFHINDDTGAVA